MTDLRAAAVAAAMLAWLAAPALAQQTAGSGGGAAPQAAAAEERDDAVLSLSQPDFTLIGLPTSLRMPARKFAFRVTHRFQRPLGQGDFGDLADDFFGLDNGAITALELRYGLFRGTQVGVHRSGFGKTIEFFAQCDLVSQDRFPFDVSLFGSMDGTVNFRESYSPALGVVLSRTVGDVAALYIEPMWVNNSNPLPKEVNDDNDTVFVGLGARIRVAATTYLVVEWSPRVQGFEPGVDAVSFGFERRVGGHVFQLNFSNSFATTMGQIARGGFNNDDWYFGFNLTRKFF